MSDHPEYDRRDEDERQNCAEHVQSHPQLHRCLRLGQKAQRVEPLGWQTLEGQNCRAKQKQYCAAPDRDRPEIILSPYDHS